MPAVQAYVDDVLRHAPDERAVLERRADADEDLPALFQHKPSRTATSKALDSLDVDLVLFQHQAARPGRS